EGLHPKARAAKEEELKDLRAQQAQHERQEREAKIALRYKHVSRGGGEEGGSGYGSYPAAPAPSFEYRAPGAARPRKRVGVGWAGRAARVGRPSSAWRPRLSRGAGAPGDAVGAGAPRYWGG
ncbi:hypothetical protein MNEG_16404, partial [Monoraphidium neglectum]